MDERKRYSVQGQQIISIREKVVNDATLCEFLNRLIETHELAIKNEGVSSLAAQFMYREAVNIAKQANLMHCSGCKDWVYKDDRCGSCGRSLIGTGPLVQPREKSNHNYLLL